MVNLIVIENRCTLLSSNNFTVLWSLFVVLFEFNSLSLYLWKYQTQRQIWNRIRDTRNIKIIHVIRPHLQYFNMWQIFKDADQVRSNEMKRTGSWHSKNTNLNWSSFFFLPSPFSRLSLVSFTIRIFGKQCPTFVPSLRKYQFSVETKKSDFSKKNKIINEENENRFFPNVPNVSSFLTVRGNLITSLWSTLKPQDFFCDLWLWKVVSIQSIKNAVPSTSRKNSLHSINVAASTGPGSTVQ